MPSLKINTTGIEFSYTDSGRPASDEYVTLVIVHGHSFHSGTFQRLLPLAASHSLRLICVNRREYQGSTPYNPEELKVFATGTDAERANLIAQMGTDLAHFVDGLILELSLPKGIALIGWSLGNLPVLSIRASIESLPAETKERLQAYVKRFILWDVPSQIIGIESSPDLYVPLYDQDIPPEGRGPAFAAWVSSYFTHGDLSRRDLAEFECRYPDPSKKPSIANMTPEEVSSVIDPAPGEKCESLLGQPIFATALANQTQKALFDGKIRDTWSNAKVEIIYADRSPWSVIYSAWILEDRVKSTEPGDRPTLNIKVIEGANHFPMWDEPEMMTKFLQGCVKD